MKKIYVLIMVLLVYASTAFAANNDFVRITGNETDIAATGEFEGMRKLQNHKYEALYEIYFTASYENEVETYNFKDVYVGKNLNEVLTFYRNGKGYSGTRGWWYKVLRSFPQDTKEHYAFKTLVGEGVYNDWFADMDAIANSDRMVAEYIQKVYLPRLYPNYKRNDGSNRYSTADIKF